MIDRAAVLHRAGRYRPAATLAAQALARAEALGHGPLVADALFRLGNEQIDAEGYATAARTLERAVYTALAAGHDDRAGWSALLLLYIAAYAGVDEGRADTWAAIAEAFASRVSDPLIYRSQLEQHLGLLARNRDDPAGARRHQDAALAAILGDPDASPIDVADQLTHSSLHYWQPGEYARALELNQRAIELAERTLGPDHVTVGRYLINQTRPLIEVGRPAEGLAAARRSQAILAAALGESHPTTGLAVMQEANALAALGDTDAGLAAHAPAAPPGGLRKAER